MAKYLNEKEYLIVTNLEKIYNKTLVRGCIDFCKTALACFTVLI